MNLIALLVCLGGVMLGILAFAVLIFQMACRWCRLDRPSFLMASYVVVVSWIVWAVVETVMIAVLQEIYEQLGLPSWEAQIVGFFLGLPAHMMVTTVLHIALMHVRLGKAVEVWFIQQLILFSILLSIIGVIVVAVMASKN